MPSTASIHHRILTRIFRRTTAAVALITIVSVPAFAGPYDDDFSNNAIDPQWTRLIHPADANMTLLEQNGRLEAIASAPTAMEDDALYLSNGPAGFKLATDTDFEIAIRFDFASATANGSTGDVIGLVFGVGKELEGENAAAIGFGYGNLFGNNIGATTVSHRVADVQTDDLTVPFSVINAGTWTISYDAAEDDLTLTDGTHTQTLFDTVRGAWNASDLYVSFGLRGKGYTLTSGDASLDDFVVRSGRVIAVPEPAGIAALLLAGVGLLVRRRGAR